MPRSRFEFRFRGNRQIVSMLLLRQKGRCFYCNIEISVHPGPCSRRKATLDHKIPLAFGGEPFGENVVVACLPCNAAKGNLDAQMFISVRDDNLQRKQLLSEATARLHAMTENERRELRCRVKDQWRESMVRLQISLGPIVREHRRRLNLIVAKLGELRA